MTSQEFDLLWKKNYPGTIPLPHLFKQDYSFLWFRIKSLPGSKIFPSNNKDLQILLERQNKIITDILGDKSQIFGITGEYCFEEETGKPLFLKHKAFQEFTFTALNPIDMHKFSEKEFKEGQTYQPYLTKLVWVQNKYDDLLKAIAFDEIRMFFMSVDKKCLIAPYDGGVDFVLENVLIKNYHASKYKDWITSAVKY